MYQCSGCGKFFSHKGPFFTHRIGSHERRSRRCLDTEEMLAKGFTSTDVTEGKNKGKTMWRMAAPEGKPANWADDSEDTEEEEEVEELPD